MENLLEIIFRIFGFLLLLISIFALTMRKRRPADREMDAKKKERLSAMEGLSGSYDDVLASVLNEDAGEGSEAKKSREESQSSLSLSDEKAEGSHLRHQNSFEAILPDKKAPSFFFEKGLDGQENFSFTSASAARREDMQRDAMDASVEISRKKPHLSKKNPWQHKVSNKKASRKSHPAAHPHPKAISRSYSLVQNLRTKKSLKEAIILREILSKPLAFHGNLERKI